MAQSPEDMVEVLAAKESGGLLFKAGLRSFALPVMDVIEVIRPLSITRVPQSPPELLGLANFRGTAVPIVSAAALLNVPSRPTPSSERIIIVKRKALVGLLVDEVSTLGNTSDANLLDLDGLLARNFQFHSRRDRKFETRLDAAGAPEGNAERELLSILAFIVADQEFALAIDQIEGVAMLPASIARVPRTDQAMLGAAEIEGALVPLISLRYLLGFAAGDLDQRISRVILLRLGEALVGVVVDDVKEILRVAEDALDQVPSVLTRGRGEAQIEAICRLDRGRRLISLLAPKKLFDGETMARVLTESQHGAVEMSSGDQKSADGEQFIVFQLGSESYGLPIGAVDEVVRCPDTLTRVPIAPAFVRGLMNLRGKALPVIDQNQRFSLEEVSEGKRKRIIVVTVEGLKAGFLVDKVSEVLTVSAEEISPAPELPNDSAGVIDRVAMVERDGHMVLLIDPKALLDRAERDVLEGISNSIGATQSP